MRLRRVAAMLCLALAGACGGAGGAGSIDGGPIILTVDAGAPMMLATGVEGGPWDIAVDATHVYWTDTTARSVMKVPKVGGAAVTLASDQMYVRHIAVDSMHVYWTNPSAVMKVPLAGGTPVALAEQQYGPTNLAVDATGVYWATFGSTGAPSAVMRASGETGAVTKLTTDPIIQPVQIAIDATAVYWVTSGEPLAVLQKVPLAGGSTTQLAGGIASASLASDGAYVYFPNWDVATGESALMKVPVGGGTATPFVSMVTGQSHVVDGETLYWAAGASIGRVSTHGGAVTVIPTGDDPINNLVVDATHLYWTSRAGRVMALAKP